LPHANERDVEDVPVELRQELELVLVDSAEEVLAKALERCPPRQRRMAVQSCPRGESVVNL